MLLNQTPAEDRVAASKRTPWRETDTPAMAVYTDDEAADDQEGNLLERILQLQVEGKVVAPPDVAVEDAIDAFIADVERLLRVDTSLQGTASKSELVRTEIDVDPMAAQPVGHFRLTYLVTYHTFAPEADDVTIDSFKKADVRYDLEGNELPADESHDVVTLEGG